MTPLFSLLTDEEPARLRHSAVSENIAGKSFAGMIAEAKPCI